jgi:hypothetical protein
MSTRQGSGRRRLTTLVGGVVAGVVIAAGAVLVATGTGGSEPPRSDAAPAIQAFAQELEGEVHQPLPAPENASHGPRIGNCDYAYGVRGECVPYAYPPAVADTPAAKCAYLKSLGARALEVPGEDTQKLVPAGGPRAPSGNPYACPAELGTAR